MDLKPQFEAATAKSKGLPSQGNETIEKNLRSPRPIRALSVEFRPPHNIRECSR